MGVVLDDVPLSLDARGGVPDNLVVVEPGIGLPLARVECFIVRVAHWINFIQ